MNAGQKMQDGQESFSDIYAGQSHVDVSGEELIDFILFIEWFVIFLNSAQLFYFFQHVFLIALWFFGQLFVDFCFALASSFHLFDLISDGLSFSG